MENTYEQKAVETVEMSRAGFADLKSQLLNSQSGKAGEDKEQKSEKREPRESRKEETHSKKYTFRKGDQSFELDDDFEIEIMADKRPTKMTLRELKDRAAGDVAVKNRMHSLAEEKKKIQATLKEFASIAKKDPLASLEFISKMATEADSEFAYDKYLEALAEQAEKLGQMDEKDRKAWELEKKLSKAEQDLSQKERQQAVVLRKQEMLNVYPEIGDSEFGQMVDAVLNNEELLEGLDDEDDVMDRVEELIQETLTQRDILTVIQEINPSHLHDNELIFSLSNQLRMNPDLDEEDVRDILRELIQPEEKEDVRQKPRDEEKARDIRTLSNKALQAAPVTQIRSQNASTYDLLKQQLMERKKEIQKTPLYKR
jgi:hypothetical protein